MAEVEVKDSGKGGKKGQQKKMKIHVDFTPMVDMNMLLITFFMFCTTLSKPQTMEISMPTNDKVTEEEQNKVKESEAITILLGDNDRVFYYLGQPKYEDYTSLVESSYNADGLRALLLERNKTVVAKVKDLKERKKREEIDEVTYDSLVTEAKKTKGSPVVMIKAKLADENGKNGASYRNLIDALDEMIICDIGRYAIVDITEGDLFLMENFEKKGALSDQIDTSIKN
ncbi:MAG TPA: biopolymer transporter ExbD [Candidatus Barnesiella excrementigallinarum]|nr:biopolymer transporter ExbD [Candidatus Barnesiella excrementigallinarum]